MPTTFVKSCLSPADLPESDRPQIAFLGRSNVGKSSLLNVLTGQKRLARVSSAPGLTQMINLFNVDGRYFLVDLPGYGFARGSKEKRAVFAKMLGDYLSEVKPLKLVILIIDVRHGFTELDEDALAQLKENRLETVVITNKTDKLKAAELAKATRALAAAHPEVTLIPHSTVTGAGLGLIREAIEKAVRRA